jgi:atypical PilZ domain-containing cyclic di-GMP receptor
MPLSFLGDGLVYEEVMPVAFAPGPLAEGVQLLRLNADNHQLLGAESSLDEVRVHEALKDESPALIHELQRLEYKINILLRLTAELAVRNSGLPPAEKVRLVSHAMEWVGARTPVGTTGVVSLYINPALPQPLKFAATVEGEAQIAGVRAAQLRFVGVSDAVAQLVDKLIFRHHRRLVAGARGSSVDIESTLRPTKIR